MIRGLTQAAADRTLDPSDLRNGTVTEVTARGVDVAVADGLVRNASHLGSYAPAVGDPVAMMRFADAWMVLGRPVGPGTATDNLTPGSANGLTVMGGTVLKGSGLTLATSVGALVTVPGYLATFYHPPGHWVLLVAGVSWFSSTVNDVLRLRLVSVADGIGYGLAEEIQAGGATFGHSKLMYAVIPPSKGGQGDSYYLTLQRIAGAGTSRVDDPATTRGFVVAIDLGDQSVIGQAP